VIPWGGTDNQGLTDAAGNPAKRMYAVGQFSRFVRPNYHRIGANASQTAALISAYKDSASPSFAIVAINPANSAISQSFSLTNFLVSSVTPWVTSGSLSLARQASVAVTNSSFAYTLPAVSIVTFVGLATAPILGIQLTRTNTLLLSWPSASTGYLLQQNSALGTSNWLNVGNPVNTVNGNNQVLVTPTGRENAYRLKSP
jgi:hypothetical protein